MSTSSIKDLRTLDLGQGFPEARVPPPSLLLWESMSPELVHVTAR